ncbi:hypothetical protein SESBI_21599 [Sesbania bispinosa]|nr:hypothetical protein SESBI_21599 [Sesbania bispinosa]
MKDWSSTTEERSSFSVVVAAFMLELASTVSKLELVLHVVKPLTLQKLHPLDIYDGGLVASMHILSQ